MTGQTCSRCGAPFEREPHSIGTGYAVLPDESRVCYWCADHLTREEVRQSVPRDRVTLYVSLDWRDVTTWTGGRVGRVNYVGARHNWSRDRRHMTMLDDLGREWYGTGAPGEYATLTLSKRGAR